MTWWAAGVVTVTPHWLWCTPPRGVTPHVHALSQCVFKCCFLAWILSKAIDFFPAIRLLVCLFFPLVYPLYILFVCFSCPPHPSFQPGWHHCACRGRGGGWGEEADHGSGTVQSRGLLMRPSFVVPQRAYERRSLSSEGVPPMHALPL